MNNFYKLIFYLMMLMGMFLAISSSSWLISWMGLELNLMSIIPLMKNKMNKFSTEAIIKYFIIQAIASSILLFSIILMVNLNSYEYTMNSLKCYQSIFISSSLLMKMGAAPFHSWLPEVVSGISWMMVFTMLTLQKMAPMILLMYIYLDANFLFLIIITSSFIGSLMGLNQVCLKKLLTYSSINHIGWMLASLMCSYLTWMIYYIIYCLMNWNIIMILNKFKINFISQLNIIFTSNKLFKIMFMSMFLSLGGLPPFLGFLPKWISVNQMINMNSITLALLLILSSLVSLYFYLRVTFTSFTLLSFESLLKFKTFVKDSSVVSITMIVFSLPLFPLINIF